MIRLELMFDRLLRVALCGVFAVALARAQGNRGSITGTITDSSGAAVADVDVAVTNIGTGEIAATRSNDSGIYSVLNLAPARYSLKFTRLGFKTIDVHSFTLLSTQVAKLDEQLELGLVAQEVTVTSEAPVLDSENATISTHLTGQVLTDLPLSIYGGRQVESFAQALTPGYAPLSNPYLAVINGTQGFTKEVTIDGTSATAQIQGDSMEIGPTMEAIQEVEAQTSGVDARNASTNGGVMMFNLKSGTNDFHGTAFGYGHNEILDARVWGNPEKPKSRFWDYGGSLGGPIRKTKTFFFGAFERYQQNDFTLGTLGSGGAATVPTQAFLNGDFSGLLDTTKVLGKDVNGSPIYSGAIFNPADPGAVFAGNRIPTSMFSSVSRKVLAIYQQKYLPESSSLLGNDRFPTSNSPAQNPNQAVVKLDHNLTAGNHLSGSWVYNHRPRTLADSGGVWELGSTTGGPLADVRTQLTAGNEFRASDSFAIRPNLLNVFNATYNRFWNGSLAAENGTNWPQQLGFGNTGADNFPSMNFGQNVNGFPITGIGNTWQGYYVASTLLLGDTLSWTKGRHTFTFGGDFRAMEIASHGGSGALTFNFSNNTTGAVSQPYANQVGFGFASFLLGEVQSATETTPYDLYGRRKAMDLFAQDSWKVTPKLTLNIGLRWDATFRFHEKYGHWANFDLNAIDPALGVRGAIEYARNGSDSFEKNEDWHNFGPQAGIAWNPWTKFVFRGSFGITYVPIGIQYFNGVPYAYAPGFRGTNSAAAPFHWDSGYPGVLTPASKVTTPPITQFPVVSIDPNALLAGYTDNFNVGVQYELSKTIVLEAGYVGNRGHHLQDSGLANDQPSAAQFFGLIKSGNGFKYVCDPGTAKSLGVPYPYAGFCAPAIAAIAPYPQIAAAETTYWYYPVLYSVGLPLGQSYYDSMVLQFTRRSPTGLAMTFNYTLSREESDTVNNFGESYDVAGIQDFNNLREAAHTLSPYDQKHVFKGAVVYELPFGHGKRFLAGQNNSVDRMVSGWRFSGLVLYASGQPLTFYSTNYYSYPAWAATYVNYNLAGYNGSQFDGSKFQQPTTGNPAPAGDLYFPKTIALNPAYGDLGNGPTRIDALRGPGLKSENVSLIKNTSFGRDGRFRLQIRAEFYNIFNRHDFNNPDTNLSSPTFGYITSVKAGPRNGQFGARFEF